MYLAFASATYALIRRVIPRAALADDLFQDTFVEVLQMYAPLAKILEIGIVFIWNYSFCRIVVFVRRIPAEPVAPSGSP